MIFKHCAGVGDAGRCVDGIGVDAPILVICVVVQELDAVFRERRILVGEVANTFHLGVGEVTDHGMVVEVINVALVVAV